MTEGVVVSVCSVAVLMWLLVEDDRGAVDLSKSRCVFACTPGARQRLSHMCLRLCTKDVFLYCLLFLSVFFGWKHFCINQQLKYSFIVREHQRSSHFSETLHFIVSCNFLSSIIEEIMQTHSPTCMHDTHTHTHPHAHVHTHLHAHSLTQTKKNCVSKYSFPVPPPSLSHSTQSIRVRFEHRGDVALLSFHLSPPAPGDVNLKPLFHWLIFNVYNY